MRVFHSNYAVQKVFNNASCKKLTVGGDGAGPVLRIAPRSIIPTLKIYLGRS